MNLYLYPIAIWVIALILLYVAEKTPWALLLCFPLAIWNAGLSIYWGRFVTRRFDNHDITQGETLAGVQSVGNLLAGASLMPGIVFLIDDPIAMSSWSTFFGICIIAGAARVGVTIMTKINHRYASYLALTVACLALPVNTTGAASVAAFVGFFDQAIDDVGAPSDWKLAPHLPPVD
jgi:hypothetical protein